MTEYDNNDRGALFKNDRKEKETHPDYNGTINVGGVDYWLNSWLKKDRNGKTYMSLSVKPKEPRQETPPATGSGSFEDDVNDEIPF